LIARLRGLVVEEDPDGTLVVDVGGVGYEVLAPLGTMGRAEPDPMGLFTLHIHTHVREDALLLYGFPTREDRAAFRNLISVSSVGPKLALAVMSTMTASQLATTVVHGDANLLVKVPGIGKKTAQRLVLELKDKLLAPPPIPDAPNAKTPRSIVGKQDLLRTALTRMGYRPAQADQAVGQLKDKIDGAGLDELVREALKLLAK